MVEINFTDQNFNQEVIEEKLPVLVDFWAQWCAPCRIIGPIVDELAKEYEGKVKVGKLNVDQNPKTAAKYGIMSIPSLLIFKNGEVTKTMIGIQGKENLKKELEKIISV